MKRLLATTLTALALSGAMAPAPALAQEPFLGEISFAAFNFAPRGWAFCDGQILPINQNQSLYSLLGTTYGGDGRTSFALPDARGRTLTHRGNNNFGDFTLGQKGGVEEVFLTVGTMPSHNHPGMLVGSSGNANNAVPTGAMFAGTGATNSYRTAGTPSAAMKAGTITSTNTGGNVGFNVLNPWVSANCMIAMRGLFPSRN